MDPVARLPICLFAKPPVAGEVKTRLIPALGAEGAARLASAFLEDTWALVSALPWASPVLASPVPWPEGLAPRGARVWLQGGGDLGARMEHILRLALAEGPMAFALGADSPGLPRSFLESAPEALAQVDALFGPSEDGGFYLLGARRMPRGLLANLPWSREDTLLRTEQRLEALGFNTTRIETFFDVDTPEDLARLRAHLRNSEAHAPATRRALEELG